MTEQSPRERIASGLDGEPREARDRDEADMWVDTYARLIAVEERVLLDMRDLASREPLRVRTQIEATNIQPMVDLISELKTRARSWTRRHLTLLSDEADDDLGA